jgi:ribosome-associated heat shock protein Hsp15
LPTPERAVGASARSAAAHPALSRLRIDKWLWAARFYKSRSLACEDIELGRVRINGVPIKPARDLKVGDTVSLRSGSLFRTVTVLALSDKRGAAPVAALLFQETPESTAQRLQAAEQRRLAPEPSLSLREGRPNKHQRAQTERAARAGLGWGDRWSASLSDD